MRSGPVPPVLRAQQHEYLGVESPLLPAAPGPSPVPASSHQRPLRSASGPLYWLLAWPGTLLPHAAAFEGNTKLPKSLSTVSTAGFSEPPALQLQPLRFCFAPCLFPIVVSPLHVSITFKDSREAQKIG